MFGKKSFIIIFSALILIVGSAAYIIFIPNPVNTVNDYMEAIKNDNYKKIYSLLSEESKENISIRELKVLYDGFYRKFNLKDKKIKNLIVEREEFFTAKAKYNINFESFDFGESTYKYEMKLKREGLINWKIVWDYNLVLPNFEKNDSFVRKRILPERGGLYDSNNNPLAVKGEAVIVGIQPAKIKDKDLFIKKLTKIININEEIIKTSINRYSNPDWFSSLITLSMKRYKELESELRPIPGIFFRKKEARVYPAAKATAHLTGYIGEVSSQWMEKYSELDYQKGDIVGKSSLERVYERKLRGENGYILYIEDEEGNKEELMRKEAVDGENVNLTIDLELQQKIYNIIKDKKASVVALNPQNSKVLALVNTPSFDPNQFSLGISQVNWEHLKNDKNYPMLNRAIQGLYTPGSVFKIFTAAAAIDSGIVNSDTKFNDKGNFRIYGNVISNYQNKVIDEHVFSKALSESINTTFAKVALKLSKNKFIEYGNKFSFEQKLDFPLEVRKSNIGPINNDIELAWTALGQGKAVTTPLQMSSLIAIIGNDGKDVSPYIIEDEERKLENEKIINKTTAQELTKMLIEVVENGTGKKAKLEGVQIAGKTGTAEIDNNKENTHAWFVGLYPAKNPELAIAIFLENGGVGGEEAAPIFKEIIK